MTLDPWRPGDPLSAGRLNALNRQAMQSRKAAVTGPGPAMVGDKFGLHAAHHVKPDVILCVAKEDFKANSLTDNYRAIDKVPSGECLLLRFSATDGDYQEESGFKKFRVWDPLSIYGRNAQRVDPDNPYSDPVSVKEGDVFYAAHNRHTNRIEVLSFSSSAIKVEEGLNYACIGDGWYEIELAEFNKTPPESYSGYDGMVTTCDPCSIINANQNVAENCESITAYDPPRTRPEGTGKLVFAHDTRNLVIKDRGHVRMLPIHKNPDTGEQYYAIISAEYEMLKVPIKDWECCDGVVVQTACDFLLIEGTLCSGERWDCPS